MRKIRFRNIKQFYKDYYYDDNHIPKYENLIFAYDGEIYLLSCYYDDEDDDIYCIYKQVSRYDVEDDFEVHGFECLASFKTYGELIDSSKLGNTAFKELITSKEVLILSQE